MTTIYHIKLSVGPIFYKNIYICLFFLVGYWVIYNKALLKICIYLGKT